MVGGRGKSHHHISIPKAVASLGSALGSFAGHNDESAAVERTAKSPNAAGGTESYLRKTQPDGYATKVSVQLLNVDASTSLQVIYHSANFSPRFSNAMTVSFFTSSVSTIRVWR